MNRLIHLWVILLLVVQPGMVAPVSTAVDLLAQPSAITILYHPDGGLVVGDQVSFEFFARAGIPGNGARIRVERIGSPGQTLGDATFGGDGYGGLHAVLLWAWNTQGLAPGDYSLQFTLTPGSVTWRETVQLGAAPAGDSPTWLQRETQCCILHAISGTAAARDMDQLARLVDERAYQVASLLGADLEQLIAAPASGGKLDINLIPRVLGQGGFTSSEVTVTYSDDSYIGSDAAIIIQHELTHRIDAMLGGDLRPLILEEGLAVYLTGGHYKIEPVMLQAAYLLRDSGYVPLSILVVDFYSHQHETGYLEAAALVGMMISTWGQDGFNQFYRDIHPSSGGNDADAIDQAMRKHFGLSIQQMDDRLQQWLFSQPVLPDMRQDLRVMVDYFDLIRLYQEVDDPSADFRWAWLPDPRQMRSKGIVADFLRGPNAMINQLVEALLRSAGQSWRAGQYEQAWLELGQMRRAIQLELKKGALT